MASEDKGFMDRLTGFGGDETAAVFSRPGADDLYNRVKQQVEQAGVQLGGGLAAIRGGKEASQRVTDPYVAAQMGITPDELQARRAVRTELGQLEQEENEDPMDFRLRMAKRAVEVANKVGNPEQLGRALEAFDAARNQQLEFQKLSSDAKRQEFDNSVATGYTAGGKPISGVPDVHQGESGLWTSENGQRVFRPFGPDFTEVDPTSKTSLGSQDSIAAQLKKNRGVGVVGKIANMAISANSALLRTDRVLATLSDLWEKGGVESVIGTSGRLISSIDNFQRNVMGVVKAFAPSGLARDSQPGHGPNGEVRSWGGSAGLRDLATAGSHWLNNLIELPEGVDRTSSAAQQHRANVMEMAYMAARLAEPSNRGLSDNDIANALTRIAGNTSNPQVMMRRFIEMQVDASQELDYALSTFHLSLGPEVSDEEINLALVGKGYQAYIDARDELFAKYGIEVDDSGRAIFDNVIGTDVQPGEGTIPQDAALPEVSLDEQSAQDYIDSIDLGD